MRLVQTFFLEGDPPTTTNQQKGYGKGRHYKKKKTIEAEKWFNERLIPYIPDKPYKGAISLYCLWLLPIKNKKRWGTWKTSKPDCDNMNKTLQDVMTKYPLTRDNEERRFWEDDSQIASLTVEKRYADGNEKTGVYIEIGLLEESEYELRFK